MIGEIIEENFVNGVTESYVMESPILLVMSDTGIAMAGHPILLTTKSKRITIKASDLIYGELFEPVDQLRNQYRSMTGTGIQLIQ